MCVIQYIKYISYYRYLPHRLLKDNSEVCLITGDLDKRDRRSEVEPDVVHYKELLKNKGVRNITEVRIVFLLHFFLLFHSN